MALKINMLQLRTVCWIILFTSTISFSQNLPSIFDIARSGTERDMKVLLSDNGVKIDALNEEGFSPLILASYRGNTDVARLLIEKGANLNLISKMGTALMASAFKGNLVIATVLLSNGANPNVTDAAGTTALMYAVKMQNKELVKLLLTYKANKDLLDSEGKSAFEYATFSGNQTIVELLK